MAFDGPFMKNRNQTMSTNVEAHISRHSIVVISNGGLLAACCCFEPPVCRRWPFVTLTVGYFWQFITDYVSVYICLSLFAKICLFLWGFSLIHYWWACANGPHWKGNPDINNRINLNSKSMLVFWCRGFEFNFFPPK